MYFYNASGQKVQKVVTENTTVTTTDYLGGYQYSNTSLQFFPTAEGYVKNTLVSGTNTYSYVFNYTDHLGNTRLSYTKDTATGSLKILEENNYYPFGLKHNSYNVDNFQPEYKYKYNGKELQDELGLNQYDYGARNYDPALGRWMNIDPLAEKSRRFSPYTYALNNPVFFIDPDGMEAKDWVRNGNSWEYRSNITSAQQAKDAGFSDYSNGKTNNTYSVGENTITLKEGGKWSSSKDNVEKTASDKANPTEIAAAKVTGKIAVSTPVPEYEFSGEVAMDMVGNMGDALSDKSNWVKGGGVGLVLVGGLTGNPTLVAGGIEIYNVGSAMDDIGSTMSALNDVADGNYNRAIIKAGAIGAGKISDGIIDKTIPAGGATNATVKAANSWYIDQLKTESINSTYRR